MGVVCDVQGDGEVGIREPVAFLLAIDCQSTTYTKESGKKTVGHTARDKTTTLYRPSRSSSSTKNLAMSPAPAMATAGRWSFLLSIWTGWSLLRTVIFCPRPQQSAMGITLYPIRVFVYDADALLSLKYDILRDRSQSWNRPMPKRFHALRNHSCNDKYAARMLSVLPYLRYLRGQSPDV